MTEVTADHACGTHRAYQLTCAEYDSLRVARGGECAICGLPEPLHIDHDHALGTAAVRGLICRRCNRALAAVDMGEREPSQNEAFYLRYAWHLNHRTEHPPSSRTAIRTFRVPDDEWATWREAAAAAGVTLSDYIREAVDRQARRILKEDR